MSELLLNDLREAVHERQAVFVIGAGVSIGATDGAECASWKGLLRHGVRHVAQVRTELYPGWLAHELAALDSADLDDLLGTADKVSRKLRAHDGGEWKTWLRAALASLTPQRRETLEALRDLGVPLATTNYDDLLCTVTERPPVTWRDGSRVERVLRGDDDGILHLHGHWQDPKSVVLGIESYRRVLGDAHAQVVLRALTMTRTLVFVGYGAGLDDPNFGALLDWTGEVFAGSEYRRFRLARGPECAALQREHPDAQRLYVLPFGAQHDDLAGFLRELMPPKAAASTPRPSTVDSAPLPPRPRCFGRDAELAALVAAVLADSPAPVPVLGSAGIGKSTLALAVAHDPRVARRFGARRLFVRCDGARTRAELVAAIGQLLGVPPASGSEPAVLAAIAAAPTLLIVDNLETPWHADTLAVEELLGLLAGCPTLALIATVRGAERPGGVPWLDPTRLLPLALADARDAFVAVAGKRFESAARLDELLRALDCVPLAVSLLAHAADAEPDLEGLWQRWQHERTEMLKRADADSRLTNLELSYELSIQGKRMNDGARRLLALLALLPAGICRDDLGAAFPEHAVSASTLRRAGLAIDEADRLRLFAPLRAYVARRYSPDADGQVQLLAHYMALVRQHGDRIGWEGGAAAAARLAREVANVEALFPLAMRESGPTNAIEAALAWGRFARFSGLGTDTSLVAAAELATARGVPEQQASCVEWLADLALARSEHQAARGYYEAALPLYRQVKSVLGEANCIKGLGDIALRRSEHEAARKHFEAALPLYQRVENVLGEANCIQSLGDIALERCEYETARGRYEAALPKYRQVEDMLGEANCIRRFGDIALRCAEHEVARGHFEAALPKYRQVGDVLGEASCIQGVGDVAHAHFEHEDARGRYEVALVLYQRVSELYSIGGAHRRLARIARIARDAAERSHHVRAARDAWARIDRQDLIEELRQEFGDF